MNLQESRDRLLRSLGREITDGRVLTAMGRVRREIFVPEGQRSKAYDNVPLPIGLGQTISQPLIVGTMTEALDLRGREKVLELGTGSGYQTAILAELAGLVISVERLEYFARSADALLRSLGYTNAVVHLVSDTIGWAEGAPYDAIIVTAGAPQVPQELIDQLAKGGRLVIPVGSKFEQDLIKLVKRGGEVTTTNLGPCRFVPLIGEGGWPNGEGLDL
ncbi:MAG: protein-L-isoaspartate(D-aspartate) O-methyltransferase [Chloroflexi bacterium]|nr:protein-L-isoaspartate(D-aspartate) O-methyltransferase [Chloroflexota bacterium]